MIFKLFRRTPRDGTIACLYGTIVAQARLPAFYQNQDDSAFPAGNAAFSRAKVVSSHAFPGIRYFAVAF
jgi:hypothetical protein